MQFESRPRQMEAVQAHPLAELLECPPETGKLLNAATRTLDFKAGEHIFLQHDTCQGLYVLVSGRFTRKTECQRKQLTLGAIGAGSLVELAAALGDCQHTYTLSAQSAGSVLLLPIDALNRAFESYPPLRMQLLEELAREVSRAYGLCYFNRTAKLKRGESRSTTV